jgi:hypothetical protein
MMTWEEYTVVFCLPNVQFGDDVLIDDPAKFSWRKLWILISLQLDDDGDDEYKR